MVATAYPKTGEAAAAAAAANAASDFCFWSRAEAIQWLRKAAAQGNEEAKWKLERMNV